AARKAVVHLQPTAGLMEEGGSPFFKCYRVSLYPPWVEAHSSNTAAFPSPSFSIRVLNHRVPVMPANSCLLVHLPRVPRRETNHLTHSMILVTIPRYILARRMRPNLTPHQFHSPETLVGPPLQHV
ncbi:unnamed protein product, partial [Ectocarpus sp. 12 AP-2014]